MNLIIDIGNTKIKASIFLKGELNTTKASEKRDVEFVKDLLSEFTTIEKVIISSVREYPERLINFLKTKIQHVFFFDSKLPIPIENLYESKKTLGYDRLAACIGAYAMNPNQNILVIDAGTAITFDFLNKKGQYIGGCISPGLSMRYKALNHFTKKLPLLSVNEDYPLIGKNTNEAITGGVQNGIVFEVDSYINQLKEKYADLKVILTGGDAPFLYKSITNIAILETDVLAIGLNHILEFNILERSNN
ncbi:type III pantothenate kinase [Marinifilum sp. D714]|uniref:type III pantothenate kinase n=1 Tax=Marinifilum sp. D714 TaxID=2937523 RepID=UPI0027C6A800|nr:type III pantothenate kinase [Marinifilum sp. D714]MDQ2180374.1 type III pantothenate kinase [Marinifilum sp. D714]